jgi:thioredoxin 1
MLTLRLNPIFSHPTIILKMKKILLPALAALLVFTQCGPSNDKAGETKDGKTAEAPKEAIKKLDFHAQDKALKEVIAAEFAAGRTPVVYFWADWCGPCKEFKSSLSDPLMQDALNNVTLIMIDTDVDDTKEKHGSEFGVSGIPAFVKVDKEGNLVDLVDGGAWDANIPANMAPVLKGFIAGAAQ